MSRVVTTANPETGAVVNPTSNPEVAYVRVEQTKEVMQDGWLRDVTRSALIMGTPEKLNAKFTKPGQVLPGTITMHENFTPAHEKQEPKINPTTGEVLTKDGKPIYRHTQYNPDPLAQDGETIQHDRELVSTEPAGVQEDEKGASI